MLMVRVVKTQTSAPQPDAGSDESGSGFNYLASGLDSTSGNIIIKLQHNLELFYSNFYSAWFNCFCNK